MKKFVKNPNIVYSIGEEVVVHTVFGLCVGIHGQKGIVTEVWEPSGALNRWHVFIVDVNDNRYRLESVFLWSKEELKQVKAYENHVRKLLIKAKKNKNDQVIIESLQDKLRDVSMRRV